MPKKPLHDRSLQLAAMATAGVFAAGFVFAPLGAWTGAVLSAWFAGTQKAWRGFLWLLAFALAAHLPQIWRGAAMPRIEFMGWTALAMLIGILPYVLYRLTKERRLGFLATLSLPFWGAALQTLGQLRVPAVIFTHYSLVRTQGANFVVPRVFLPFLVYWTAAAVNWMWGLEFRRERIAAGASVFGVACLVVLGYGRLAFHALPAPGVFAWASLAGGLLVTGWSFLWPDRKRKTWADKTETVALLRSPRTGEPLHFAGNGGEGALVSSSGERFPVRGGIPVFARREDLIGSNGKYHHLYETIGGFYDDSQRVGSALLGIDRDEIFLSYLRFLEVRPGDSVLETSVGTGLNLKYLPRGVKLFGLDLSAEMLASCQTNLRRWELDADLFLGNAEELPFADGSFDVVFHSGGINFFNDRARAIREMIRVARPGSRILIADETEKYVKGTYERNPVTSGYYKNRPEAVAAPLDLVPAEMQEISLEALWDGKFYALTCRKPPGHE